ncbi:MarR family winged helix-turn-helix transcriptional regulator [Wenxinia marina]|uniref:Transcriptional regulator n=1 Tax=Wenxinia marina DSM 24838 TaxID=1123501 RepID=A0A0D0PEJ6_9RHOB|nr:MarR family winged helix-turn-helix transcriptional regulator [Wenxinia marina]KIQ69826.1 Transcriptional regulator [Wenxinia marina DSM 24838]GGL61550.1 hypothetical protein GCM10011392_14990 [Wenxinia marina]
MDDGHSLLQPALFRLKSGAQVRAGWMAHDLPFLTRSLRFLMRADSDMLRREMALEPGEIGIIGLLAENPGISQNDLAMSLVLKKSAVTKLVQGLEKRGLLDRQRSESDRRSNELTLTAAGREKARAVHLRVAELHRDWFAGIPPRDQAVFFSVLFRVVATMAERSGEAAAMDGGGSDD